MEYIYYGRMDSITPQKGVHYMMIDETIKKSFKEAEKKYKDDLENWMAAFKKDCKSDLNGLKLEFNLVKRDIQNIYKILKDLSNNVRKPLEVKPIGKKKRSYQKKL